MKALKDPGIARLNRRTLLASSVMLTANFGNTSAAEVHTDGVHVHEVTMAAPDVVRITVRDQAIRKGPLIAADAPDPGNLNQTVAAWLATQGSVRPAVVVGRGGTHLRFYDERPTLFLDREAADAASNYTMSGGNTVASVYRLSMPYDQGTAWFGRKINCVSFEHQLFLKLEHPLQQGSLEISNDKAGIVTRDFLFSDTATRACSIRSTQIGHRSGDSSKTGYLSLWIPGYGHEGQVDFVKDYGLAGFDIIDNDGKVVWSGEIKPQIKAETKEDASPLIAYPSVTTPPRIIKDIIRGQRTVITVPEHGFLSGQKKCFRGVAGLNGMLEGQVMVVDVIDRDSFSIPLDTTSASAYFPNTYLEGYDSLVYDVSLANRAATDVFRLDYSKFRPSEAGVFRLRIANLGCSDAFRIDEAVHYDAAHHSMKGYYNQCWGMALSRDIGGWDRPVNYHDGVNGVIIRESMLPACMEAESGMASIALTNKGHLQPWITTERVSGWFGGWSDAGDWDMHISRHGTAVWSLLDLGYERLPHAARATQFGFPKSSVTFADAGYEGTEVLPDAIHMAVYYIEPLRKYQKPDGRVYGGLNYDGAGGGSTGGGNGFEPSWISQQEAHLLAADHCSNFMFAACAAKLGRLLVEAGFSGIGARWIESGERAWQWAEEIWSSYRADGLSGSAWRRYYDGELNAIANSGWNEQQVKQHFDDVQNLADGARVFAAGPLFTATNSDLYRLVFETELGAYSAIGTAALGVWDYSRGKRGDALFKDYYNGSWRNVPVNSYRQYLQGTSSYVYAGAGNFFSPSGVPANLLFAFLTTPRVEGKRYLELIHAGEDFVSGANQSGLCCTVGIGKRWPTQPLHRDREATGLDAAGVPGLTLFTWWHDNAVGFYVFNFGDDNPINFVVDRPLAGHSQARVRMAEPYFRSIPAMEQHWQNTFVIYNTEFVTQDQIVGRFIANLWRHGWDGNPSPPAR